jgi:tetratricopeptide (TPR) repeat protein
MFNNQQRCCCWLLIVGPTNLSIIDDGCTGKQLTNNFTPSEKENNVQSSAPTPDKFTGYYTTAIDALCEIARLYFFLGRLADALHLLRTSLQMIEVGEVKPGDRLKLLLLYGKVLTVNSLITRGDSDLMFSVILQAKQIAEAAQDQQSGADALNLLAQARQFAVTIANVKSGTPPFSLQNQGKYDEALAYQQQALKLQEALHDTQGISESYFAIGCVYQFYQQNDLAQEHFTKAIQVAEQHGHVLEQAEPNRHLAVLALVKGNLDQALTHALQALSFREAGGFRPYQPLDHLLLWSVYQAKGDTANAQLHMQQASAIAEEMGFPTLVSGVLNSMSRMSAQ